MAPNIPTQSVQNETPVSQPNPQQQPINKILSSGSKWKLITLIIILLVIVGGTFYLEARQNKLIIQTQQQKVITPTTIQSTSTPSQTPLPTIEPGKPIDTTNWTIFRDSATSLSLKYPASWQITEGPKSANTAAYDYEYLKFSGKEGSIVFTKANQLGGACDDYRNISINGSIASICQFKRSGTEDESWSQLYVRPLTHISDPTSDPKDFAFDINGTIHQPLVQNRDIILQILNTITGVKIPAD